MLSIDASRRKLLLTVLPGQGPPGELIYEDGWGEEAAWVVDPPGSRLSGSRMVKAASALP